MPEPLSGPWPEQLEALLERLRQDGFRVGVAETLRVHQLLLALVERGVPLDSPERLARLLGPVLCRSAREQETIQRHLAEWWPGPQPLPEPLSGPAAELDAALRRVERHRQGVLRWLPTTPLALGLTAALAAAGWVGLVELRQRLSPEPPARLEQPVAAPAPPPVKPPPLPRPQPPQESIAPPQDPARWPGSRPKLSKPIAPARDPAAPAPALASDNGLFLLPGELALLLGVGLLASLLAVQGAVRGWWWVQAWLLLERLPPRGDPELHRLSLGELERQLVALPEAHRIGRALNVWQRLPSEELDGGATVEASLRAGGWLSPRYGQRRQRQSYLFLLEQKSLADQQTRHLRAWLEGLDREGVLVEWECFQREPLVCQGPEGHGPRRRLAELAARHSEALVVVVADGERLFSPVDGAPRPWLRRLAVWPRQVVLTPRPRERWGVLEAELAQQLPVLPATPEGLLELGRWLREDPSLPLAAVTTAATLAAEPADPADHPIEPPEPPLLQGSATPWLERSPPAPAVVRELLAQLRSHLGPEGFYWLAACAVFPELHWTITLHLGQRLRGADGQPLPRHCPLPRLARLPWLRHGHLPDWLRLVLIRRLTPVQEAAVREVLTILLLAVVPQPAEGEEKGEVGEAELRVATELLQRLPRLLPPLLPLLLPLLLERLRRRAGPLSPLRDQLFLRFLRRRPLLAADAPESLRSLLRERPSQRPGERWWHRPRPWRKESEASAGGSWRVRELAVAGLLVLVLGGLGLVTLREVQRAWIERLLRTPSAPAVSDAERVARLRRAVTALGLSRSSLMRLGPDPELGRVERALGRASETPGPRRANLRGHEGWVRSAAFSPDGSRIVSAGRDGTVRQWEVSSGREIGAPLTGHQGVVLSAAFNADGRRIVSAGEDGTVRLWDARSGKAIGEPLRGHEGWVRSAVFSPDGSRIVSAGRDGTVRLWDASSGKEIGEPLRGGQGALLSAAFSADGNRIVSAGEDGTVRLWDARSGTGIGAPLRGHEGWVRSAAFSPDGSRIVSAGRDGVVRLWDARSGREIGAPLRGHQGALLSAAFSADGRRIVSAGEDGTVRLWDARSGTAIGEPLRGHAGWVSSAVFNADGSWIVSAGEDGIVRLWGLSSVPANPPSSDPEGRATPDWRRILPVACDKLEFSPELTRLPWLNTARATCQHFVWSRRQRQSLEPWTVVAAGAAAAAGGGALAAGGLMAWGRLQRRRDSSATEPPAAPTATAEETKPLRVNGRATGRTPILDPPRLPTPRKPTRRTPVPRPQPAPVSSRSEPPAASPLPGPKLITWTVPTAQLLREGGDWRVRRDAVAVRGYREELDGDVDLPMLLVPAGTFFMGSPPEETWRSSAEGPRHQVALERFFMGQTPITQAQWRAVAQWRERPGERWGRRLNPSPSRFANLPDSPQRPVERVNWHEAMEFCSRLRQRTGRSYTLPSEAQWEYACRAGTNAPFAFGDTLTPELANYDGNYSYANGPIGEFRRQTTPVGMFPANAWGLLDMHGNVWEWCLDHWHGTYQGGPTDGQAWLDENARKGASRLLRGGSWFNEPQDCRSAYRDGNHPDNAYNGRGFRVCCLPQD